MSGRTNYLPFGEKSRRAAAPR